MQIYCQHYCQHYCQLWAIASIRIREYKNTIDCHQSGFDFEKSHYPSQNRLTLFSQIYCPDCCLSIIGFRFEVLIITAVRRYMRDTLDSRSLSGRETRPVLNRAYKNNCTPPTLKPLYHYQSLKTRSKIGSNPIPENV